MLTRALYRSRTYIITSRSCNNNNNLMCVIYVCSVHIILYYYERRSESHTVTTIPPGHHQSLLISNNSWYKSTNARKYYNIRSVAHSEGAMTGFDSGMSFRVYHIHKIICVQYKHLQSCTYIRIYNIILPSYIYIRVHNIGWSDLYTIITFKNDRDYHRPCNV